MGKIKKNTLVEGTIIAYMAIIIIKILGAIYVIPFYKIIGEEGGVLYSYAYNVYNLFLNISTSGIPIAMSIIVSEYIALNKIKTKEKAFKIANKSIFIIAFLAFLVMFFLAPYIAKFFVKDLVNATAPASIALAIRVVSLCLLIIPFLSVMRGYLQGHKYISLSSISQVIEQVIRIFIVLVGSYIAINVLKYDIKIGVCVALSGAFIGGIFAFIYIKRKGHKNSQLFAVEKNDEREQIDSNKVIIKKIIKYAIPVIIIAISQDIYSITDQKLILKGLSMIGYEAKTTELIASVNVTWGPKICMIIGALGMGLSTSLIPHVVSSYIKKDYKDLNKKFSQAINTVIIIAVPLTIGLIMLSKSVYYIFYNNSYYGDIALKLLAVIASIAALNTILNMMLQSMQKYKVVYANTIIGIIINACLDIPIILLLNKLNFYPFIGSLVATIIGQSVSLIILLAYFKKTFKFSYKDIIKLIKKQLLPIILMIIVLLVLNIIIPITTNNYIVVALKLMIYAILGGSVYLICMYKNNSINEVFGKDGINRIINKFRRKKSA